jgi:hypothetical protein
LRFLCCSCCWVLSRWRALTTRPTGELVNRQRNAQGFQVKLDSVRVGEVEVLNVDAVVMPQAMPLMLLGNSFLNRFQMLRDNDQLTLTKKY